MKLRLGVLFLSLATGLFVSCASSGTAAKKADERLANLEPFEIGSMTLGQIKMFSDDVEQKKLDIRLYPRTGQLCLEFFSLPNKQRLYLDRSAREILSAAFLAYKDDFSAKKLLRGTQKSSSAYGKKHDFLPVGCVDLQRRKRTCCFARLPVQRRFSVLYNRDSPDEKQTVCNW
jgi:hypothetical protein